MILVITEYCTKSHRSVVSHGIDLNTDENVVLPQVTPKELGAYFDYNYGEWILK